MSAAVSSGKILAVHEIWLRSYLTDLWKHEQKAYAAAIVGCLADSCDALEVETADGKRPWTDALMSGPAILPLCS